MRSFALAAFVCFSFLLFPFAGQTASAAQGLTVISTLPQGEVGDLTQITVRFSEAMRPLGVMEQEADGSPLRLTVPGGMLPAGNYRWLDPATLSYLFDAPVDGPFLIEAVIPAGTKALSGAVLEKATRWTVSTPAIKITLSSGPLPPKGATISLASNHALDLDDLKAKTSLKMDGKSLPLEFPAPRPYSRPDRRPNVWHYTVRVMTELPAGKTLSLTLEPGIRPANGSVPAKGFSFALRSYSPLAVEKWNIHPEKEKGDKAAPEAPLRIEFSNPVMYKDLLKHLSVSPAVPELAKLEQAQAEKDGADDEDNQDGGYGYRSRKYPSSSQELWFSWSPRTTYTVTLHPGLVDEYGSVLAKETSYRFTTGDYQSLFSMPGGEILEARLSGILPLVLRNVSPVDITLRSLPWGDAPYAAFTSYMDSSMAETRRRIPDAEEKTLHLDFSSRHNTNIREELDLLKILGSAGGSLITMRVTTPRQGWGRERDGKDTHDRTLQITDIGLTSKMGRENGLAWATSLSGGQPLEGVELTLHSAEAKKLWQGKTDAKGLASLPGTAEIPNGRLYLKALKGSDVTVSEIWYSRGHANFSNLNAQSDREKHWSAHVVSQLPLYQPGQTVRFVLYSRVYTDKKDGKQQDSGNWQAIPAGEIVSYRIRTPRGKEVLLQEGAVNAYGSLSGTLALPAEAELGAYSFAVKRAGSVRETWTQGFTVASFRPPDFKVDVKAPDSQPNPPQAEPTLSATVSAGYFSGAALTGAKTVLAVRSQQSWFVPGRLQGWQVGAGGNQRGFHAGVPEYYRPYPSQRASINGTLDTNGNAVMVLPALPVEPGGPQAVSLEATVTDASGLTSQGTASFILHPSASYVGLRAPFLTAVNQPATLELKAATFDDKALSGVTVSLRAERRKKYDNDYEAPVWEKDVTLARTDGDKVSLTLAKSGLYRISAVIKDAKGRENLTQSYMYVPGPDLDWGIRGRSLNLELMQDAQEYTPGSTARVVVKNPLAQGDGKTLALITVEREGVRETRVQELSGPAPVIEVPLQEKDAPYVFLSVLLIQGRTAPPPDGDTPGPDSGAPKALLGVTCLRVQEKDRGISAAVSTDAKTYRPGAKVTATVTVRDSDGKGRRSEVTLLAVDARVLRAAGEKTNYDPARTFNPMFSYGVGTTDNRHRLVDLGVPNLRQLRGGMAQKASAMMGAEMAKPASAPMENDGDGNTPLRENFAPDVFWLAQAETDANGRLSAVFTLPDTLTTYRIVAVVADKGRHFATIETSVIANKPLQLLSAMPRFATEGDRLSARVLVQNLGKTESDITVTATAAGMVLDKPDTQRIRLKAGGSGMVAFSVRTPAPGAGSLRVQGAMTSDGKQEKDGALFQLPIVPAAPMTTVAAAGLLKAGEQHTLPVQPPAPLDARSRMEVIFAASPAAGLPLTAKNLLDYPWHCLEQRLSRVWVRALRLKHGDLLGLPSDPDDRKLIKEVMQAVERFQKPDGGFALWSELQRSDMYLTSYVLLVNSQMKELNLALPREVERKTLEYLSATLDRRPDDYSPDVQAMAVWILSRGDSSAAQGQRHFPKVRDRVLAQTGGGNPMGLAALLLAAHELPRLESKEKTIADLFISLEKSAAVTPTQLHFATRNAGWHWQSMGSTLRGNGLVLWALTRVKPDYPRLEALAYWLSQGLGEKKVLSTQEAMFGLLGLSAYLEQLGGNQLVSLKAVWNGKESMTKSFTRLIDPPQRWVLPADKLAAGTSSGLELSALSGNPYWTARLTYSSPSLPVQAENAGMVLTHAWDKTGPWQMGQEAEVTLTLTVPATRRHVLVFDPFPAGLEPLHASRADLQAQDLRRGYPYPWQRAELRDTGLLLYAEQVNPGTYTYKYKLRAAAPGSFVRAPSYAEEMYTPEVFGRTGGETVDVTP